MLYLVIKALHILAVIAWMAGLLYMPRLFAYHTRAAVGSEMDDTFRTMEAKLEKIIMNPSAVMVALFGATLIWLEGGDFLKAPWMMLKLAFVAGLYAWHLFIIRARRVIAAGGRPHSEKFWRMTNELPFLGAIVIVFSVVTKFGM